MRIVQIKRTTKGTAGYLGQPAVGAQFAVVVSRCQEIEDTAGQLEEANAGLETGDSRTKFIVVTLLYRYFTTYAKDIFLLICANERLLQGLNATLVTEKRHLALFGIPGVTPSSNTVFTNAVLSSGLPDSRESHTVGTGSLVFSYHRGKEEALCVLWIEVMASLIRNQDGSVTGVTK